MPFVSIDNLRYSKIVNGSSDKTYTVTWDVSQYDKDKGVSVKDWACTCPDWTYRKVHTGGYCKHIETVRSLPTEEGGPCFWYSTSLNDAVMIPDLEASLKLYFASSMKRFTNATVISCWNNFLMSFIPFAPCIDEDGYFIPAIFVPSLNSSCTYFRNDNALEVHLVVVDMGKDDDSQPEDLEEPPVESVASVVNSEESPNQFLSAPVKGDVENYKNKLGSGHFPRRMGMPFPRKGE